MAKELPFFKFEPNQWENGNIQLCSFEAQGVFINVCSVYWQRLGDLPYKLAVQKICSGNATALDSLCKEGVLKVIDGHICIDFLNEQLSEFENNSKTNSKNARSGWEKRRKNATALQPHEVHNAIRGEEIREDESKKRAKPFFDDYYQSKETAFDDIKNNQKYIEEDCVMILSGRGWKAVTPLDIIALLQNFLNGKADLNKQKSDVRQHFKNWIGSGNTKLENLQTLSTVFKKSL